MSRLFADDLRLLSLRMDGHRVLHALLHRTCRELPKWSPYIGQPEEGFRARSVTLRNALGLLDSKSNRNLRNGIEDLNTRNIFQDLQFLHGSEFIAWRFRDEVLSAVLDDQAYGLLDASAFRSLKSEIAFHLFYHVSIARRMRKSVFDLTVPHAGIWADKDESRWSDVSGDLINGLRLAFGHYGLTACVLLGRRGMLRGIDTVEVRLRRPGSYWSEKSISMLNPETAKCLVVDGSGYRAIPKNELSHFVVKLRDARWRLGEVK